MDTIPQFRAPALTWQEADRRLDIQDLLEHALADLRVLAQAHRGRLPRPELERVLEQALVQAHERGGNIHDRKTPRQDPRSR